MVNHSGAPVLVPFSHVSGREQLAAFAPETRPPFEIGNRSRPIAEVSHEGRGVLTLLMGIKHPNPMGQTDMNRLLKEELPSHIPIGNPGVQRDWVLRSLCPNGVLKMADNGKRYSATPLALYLAPLIAFMIEHGEQTGRSMSHYFGSPLRGIGGVDSRLARISGLRYVHERTLAGSTMRNSELAEAMGYQHVGNARTTLHQLADNGFFRLDAWSTSIDHEYEVMHTPQSSCRRKGVAGVIVNTMREQSVIRYADLEHNARTELGLGSEVTPQELSHTIATALHKLIASGHLVKVEGSFVDDELVVSDVNVDHIGAFLEGIDRLDSGDGSYVKRYGSVAIDLAFDGTDRLGAAVERFRKNSGRVRSERLSNEDAVLLALSEADNVSSRDITQIIADLAAERPDMRVLGLGLVSGVLAQLHRQGKIQSSTFRNARLYSLAAE